MKNRKQIITYFKEVGYSSISIVLFFLIWELISKAGWLKASIIPPPTLIFKTMLESFQKGEMQRHLVISLKRASVGFSLAILVAVPLGFLLGGVFKRAEPIFVPLFRLLEKINPFALFPVVVMIFKIGEMSKIVILFWVSLWPIFFNTLSGTKNIDPLYLKSARSMGSGPGTLFFKVILPAATPGIFTGIKLGAQIAFFFVVAAELLGASNGLGWYVYMAQAMYAIPLMYATIIVISVLGVLINRIFTRIEGHFLVWQEAAFEESNS